MYERQKIKSVTQSLEKMSKTLIPTKLLNSPMLNTFFKTITTRYQDAQLNFLESQLQQQGFSQEILRKLFDIKCLQSGIKFSDIKYKIFVKAFQAKFNNNKTIVTSELNLKQKSLAYLINNIKMNQSILGLELSNIYPYGGINLILSILKCDNRLIKLSIRNMNLQAQQIRQIFQVVLEKQQIIDLDISNKGSQNVNKIGESTLILQRFLIKNKTMMMLQLEGLNLRQRGLQSLERGFNKNNNASLLSLNLRNNSLSKYSYEILKTLVVISNLKQLNISENNLTNSGIQTLIEFKYSQIIKLNLSNIGLQSSGFIVFLQILKDNKNLETLIVDRNDFSETTFQKIKQVIPMNKSLQDLSMVDCRIKKLNFLFDGLIDNYSLKKLNVSSNILFQKYEELCEFIKHNDILTQLRMKFCGIESIGAIKIAQSLIENKTLNILDISQNLIGFQAGRQFLTTIYSNDTLQVLNLDKTQIEMSTRKFIQEKLQNNYLFNLQKKKNQLNIQNVVIKSKEKQTYQQLESIVTKFHKNNQNIQNLKHQIQALQIKLSLTKKHYNQTISYYEVETDNLNKQFSNINTYYKPKIKQFEDQTIRLDQKINQTRNLIQQDQYRIKKFEVQLKVEKQRIKQLQTKLQLDYSNKKYLNKRILSPSLPKLQKKQESRHGSQIKLRKSSQIEKRSTIKLDSKHK